MKRMNLTQGTPEWAAHRARHFNASDAAAMLGCSPHKTRSELLHELHTGIAREFSDYAQERVIDPGHRFEALARPLAEDIVGEPLYPVVGVEGRYSASFDGLTMAEDVAFEHKTINDELRSCMRDEGNGFDLPKHYRAQMEHQLMVAGAERVLFMATKWTPSGEIVEKRHCWYASDPQLRAELIAGWRQFEQDLAAYVPPAAAEPAPTGRAPETLPALRIEISGAVTASNLAEFKATALGAIRSVNRDLTTDQHFADAEQAVKWCGEVESRIKAAKEHALSQTASIDALFKTLDDVSAEARKVRLDLEKLVERRKTELKGELVAEAKAAYDRHEVQCRQETGGAWIMLTPPDFGSAIKGKRNIESMRDALDTTLAKAKIAVSEQASKIRANLAALDAEIAGHEHLFRDRLTFINLTPEAVRLMARQRIAEHLVEETRRAAELAERERARIRAEEQERADREARERAAAEARQRQEQEAAERRQREEIEARERQQREATAAPAPAPTQAPVAAPAPAAANVHPLPTRAPAVSAQPTLKLGEIQRRLAPVSIDAAGLAHLGFPHAAQQGAAKLWHAHQFHGICAAIAQHVVAVANGQREVA